MTGESEKTSNTQKYKKFVPFQKLKNFLFCSLLSGFTFAHSKAWAIMRYVRSLETEVVSSILP